MRSKVGKLTKGYLAAGLIVLGFAAEGFSQRVQTITNGALAVTLPFGTLTPANSSTPSSVTVQFRLRSNNATGYHLNVLSASFTPSTTAAVDGGATIAASDIGVGITAVITAPGFSGQLPRNDVVTSGFDYNPGGVTAVNGLTPFAGIAGSPSRGTLADLVATPNITILSGNIIAPTQGAAGAANFLTVTMVFALLGQYFTPATFSGVIMLQIIDLP